MPAPALPNSHAATTGCQAPGPAVLGRAAEAKATGATSSCPLQHLNAKTCAALQALRLNLDDHEGGTVGKYLLSWGRQVSRTYPDIPGQQTGFREFLLEVFTFEAQNHCEVKAVTAPPVQERRRAKAGGFPTFPTLQRHQVAVVVQRRDDNVHKVELTLRREQ